MQSVSSKTIGARLLALRNQAGLDLLQLSQMIGAEEDAIAKWELGESFPDVESVVRLSRVFSVSTDFLLIGSAVAVKKAVDPGVAARRRKVWLITGMVMAGLGLIGSISAAIAWIVNPMPFFYGSVMAPMDSNSVVFDSARYSDFRAFLMLWNSWELYLIACAVGIIGLVILLFVYVEAFWGKK